MVDILNKSTFGIVQSIGLILSFIIGITFRFQNIYLGPIFGTFFYIIFFCGLLFLTSLVIIKKFDKKFIKIGIYIILIGLYPFSVYFLTNDSSTIILLSLLEASFKILFVMFILLTISLFKKEKNENKKMS
jgi:hypothetical protein